MADKGRERKKMHRGCSSEDTLRRTENHKRGEGWRLKGREEEVLREFATRG